MLKNPHTFGKEYKIVKRLTVQDGNCGGLSLMERGTVEGPAVIDFKHCCGDPAKIGKSKY